MLAIIFYGKEVYSFVGKRKKCKERERKAEKIEFLSSDGVLALIYH